MDYNLENSLSGATKEINQITLMLIVLLCIFWFCWRTLRFFLVEKNYIEKLIYKINNCKFIKNILYFINPDINFPIITTSTILNLTDRVAPIVSFVSDDKRSSVKFKEEEIDFNGRRALLLLYFYNNQDNKKNFHDFNKWLSDSGYKKNITNSRIFRSEIEKINGRFTKESKYISEIILIEKKLSNNRTISNQYKYNITYKNL